MSAKLVPLIGRPDAYVPRPGLFDRPGSWPWFWRHYQAELIARGLVVLHLGRWHTDDPHALDAFVVEIARRNARRTVKAAA